MPFLAPGVEAMFTLSSDGQANRFSPTAARNSLTVDGEDFFFLLPSMGVSNADSGVRVPATPL